MNKQEENKIIEKKLDDLNRKILLLKSRLEIRGVKRREDNVVYVGFGKKNK